MDHTETISNRGGTITVASFTQQLSLKYNKTSRYMVLDGF